MAKLSVFQNNLTLEKEGVWEPFGEDIEVRIARLGNPNFDKFIRDDNRANENRYRLRKMTDDEQADQMKRAVAATIVTDWKNIEDDNGEPVECNYQNALAYFQDPKYQDFYTFCLRVAADGAKYKESVAKN